MENALGATIDTIFLYPATVENALEVTKDTIFLCPVPVENTSGVAFELIKIPIFFVQYLWRMHKEWQMS